MVSILNEMFMNILYIYIYIYIYVYMIIRKCLNPWLLYVTKIKFKGKSTKELYACMVHRKGI